jgi:hypothetical protein
MLEGPCCHDELAGIPDRLLPTCRRPTIAETVGSAMIERLLERDLFGADRLKDAGLKI